MTNIIRLRLSQWPWRTVQRLCCILLIITCCWLGNPPHALAKIDNDRLDGNIFVLYAGNGSLVPLHETLAEAKTAHRPVLLVFYLDDSSDCKAFAITVSRVQEYYGRRTSVLPINIDALNLNREATPQNPEYYYYGQGVPQIVILDQEGKVRFNHAGAVPYETLDTVFREVFDLEPAENAAPLQRRIYNEFNTELAQ